jgi:RimJ/RimL family protein N-acetyltransferase
MGSGRDGTVKDNTIVLKTGKTVSYRLLQRGDEKALQRFHEHLSKRSQELFTPHAYTNDVLQKIIQRTEEGTDRAYTLWDGIRCIAYFYLWWFNTDYPVLGIGIIDEFQGMGLGRRLINIMLEDAVRAGRAGVELTTELENARAKALYEAMGFKTLGVVENQNGDGRTNQEYHMFYPIKPGATPPERSFGPPV